MSMERPNVGPTPGSVEYDDIKKKMNNEGFSSSDDGEAMGAVFIGSKEEVTRAMEKAESEGRTADVASYIRLNKKIIVTPEELNELAEANHSNYNSLVEQLAPGSYLYNTYSDFLAFKDSQGNIARVDFDYDKIANVAEQPTPNERRIAVDKQLSQLGFSGGLPAPLFSFISDDRRKLLEKKHAAETKAAFNF